MAKRKKNKKRQKGQNARMVGRKRRPYDVRMIRDFIHHLLWEIRCWHFDYTAKFDARPSRESPIKWKDKKTGREIKMRELGIPVHPELSEQLGK